ncbi:MAG TPA: DoxX family protein [Candidatus Limnocylindrales bacterium]|nr:DoxX family protein [Candidatus Limnocylindrales bacterium]
MQFLRPYADITYALLRIVTGFLFACHGAQKVFGMFGGSPPEAPAFIIWTAGPIELIGGLLVMVGWQTSIAAFICSGTMAVGYFMAHQKDGLLPIQNHGELAAIYAFVFLYLASRGDGRLSIGGGA